MRTALKLLLFILLIPGYLEAQQLTKEDMIEMYYMPITDANDFLQKKSWYFDQSQNGKTTKEAGWSYSDSKSDLIMAYVSMLEPEESGKTIVYTTFSFKIFQDFREALSEFELIETVCGRG